MCNEESKETFLMNKFANFTGNYFERAQNTPGFMIG